MSSHGTMPPECTHGKRPGTSRRMNARSPCGQILVTQKLTAHLRMRFSVRAEPEDAGRPGRLRSPDPGRYRAHGAPLGAGMVNGRILSLRHWPRGLVSDFPVCGREAGGEGFHSGD